MSPIVHLPPDVISLLLSALTEQNEYPSILQASWICSSALNVCFSSLSDLAEDKVPVCPSVLVSCLLPSSSSRCVVSTSEKGGTKKKKKKKSSTSQNLFPITVPICPFRPSGSRPVEVLSPFRPGRDHVAADRRASVSRAMSTVSRWFSPLGWGATGSSSCLVARRMCFGVRVPPFLLSWTA